MTAVNRHLIMKELVNFSPLNISHFMTIDCIAVTQKSGRDAPTDMNRLGFDDKKRWHWEF